ncbi:hypothetical protein LTR08_009020 [Meristemomyces frigidus]|nr:hypothetical protein LTR08_009020 [Meristemomyces frigidus]
MTGPYGPQTPLSAPPIGGNLKRPFPLDAPYPAGREIRPKPFPTQNTAVQPSTSEPPIKRKRGRPPNAVKKAEVEAEAAAAATATTRSDPGPAAPLQLQASPRVGATAGSVRPATAEEPKPPPLPPSRMPISAVLTPNAPKTVSSTSSSSGKRRRGRSTRSEPEGYGLGEPAGSARAQEYESPYGRAADVPPDTPARTAAMRHREDLGGARLAPQVPRPSPAEPAL